MTLRIALVTGAAGGIGEACVKVLTAEGYTVIGVDIKQPLKTTAARDFHLVNLADPDAITKLAAAVSAKYNKLHVLVNNAGVYHEQKIEETQVEDWNRILNINARAPFLLVKDFLSILRNARGASVVNVASVQARATGMFVHSYVASKGALVGVTRSLAIELDPDKIRVNAVNPGCIRTPMNTEISNQKYKKFRSQSITNTAPGTQDAQPLQSPLQSQHPSSTKSQTTTPTSQHTYNLRVTPARRQYQQQQLQQQQHQHLATAQQNNANNAPFTAQQNNLPLSSTSNESIMTAIEPPHYPTAVDFANIDDHNILNDMMMAYHAFNGQFLPPFDPDNLPNDD